MRYYFSLILISLVFALIASLPESKGYQESPVITQCGGFQSLQASPYYQSYNCSGFSQAYSAPVSYSNCGGFQSAPVQYSYSYRQPSYYQRSYPIQSPVRFQSPIVPISYPTSYPVIRSQSTWSCGPNGCVLIR